MIIPVLEIRSLLSFTAPILGGIVFVILRWMQAAKDATEQQKKIAAEAKASAAAEARATAKAQAMVTASARAACK